MLSHGAVLTSNAAGGTHLHEMTPAPIRRLFHAPEKKAKIPFA
jgi:hypothetical protein